MAQAARAIIIDGDKILVMRRDKEGSTYYTLVGGQVKEGEDIVVGLTREVKEETGLDVVDARYVFYEDHPAPYDAQFIFLVQVAPGAEAEIQEWSEEAKLNRFPTNKHALHWVYRDSFGKLSFRTPLLQKAIVKALNEGFPPQPIRL